MDPDPESYILLLSVLKPFDFGLIFPIVIILVLLALSALVSGSEVAFFALTPTDQEELKQQTKPEDAALQELLQQPERLLATILINNNLINIAIILLSTIVLEGLFDFQAYPIAGFIVNVVVVTFLLLMFGEIMPKVYASSNRLLMARLMAGPTRLSIKFWKPLSFLLIRSGALLNVPVKRRNEISIDDLSEALKLTEDGSSNGDEQKILEGIVRFGGTNVKQIMKPRTDVEALDIHQNYNDVLTLVKESGYSRIPVYERSFDNIKGVLYIKDLLPYINEDNNFQWSKLIRKPFFVPESKKIDDLLKEFRTKKIHLAIVVDEFGGTSGIITLEDVLEEIVGEISDEFDDDEVVYSKLDDRNFVFEGKTHLQDFYRVLQIEGDAFEAAKGDADTLAGFVLEISGKFPEKNESIAFDQYLLTTELILKRRIQRIKVTITEPSPSNENPSNETD